jgi:proline iminopeptidase
MKRKGFLFIKYGLLICLLIFLFKILYPINYNVPHIQKRAGTQYWNLSTGSNIGYTLIEGKGSKKLYPVIYLHGGPGGHVTGKDIQMLSPLADSGYDVYLYDQTGSGQSSRLNDIEEYTVARHIADLKEIIQRTGKKKAILIGQSWGSILAALFVADNPEKIEKIIFTSPGPVYPVHMALAAIKAPDSFHLRNPYFTNAAGNETANNLRTKAMSFIAVKFGKRLASDNEADDFATYLNYEVDKSTVCDTANILPEDAGSGYYAGVMTYNNLTKIKDKRPQMRNIKIPVLIMKGQCDNQRWGFTQEYLQLFQNSQFVIIPGAGHFIAVEQPVLYINTIQHFLNK